MDSVLRGPNFWKLTIRRSENGIVVLRAVTWDACAVFPDAVQDVPIVEIAANALSPQGAAPEGEEILIANGPLPPNGDWSSEKLTSLSLPSSIRKIGSFAFLNCRELRRLELHDSVESWGQGIFIGCQKLHEFTIHGSGASPDSGTVAWYIASTMTGDLDITLQNGEETARLIFPEYEEYEEENNLVAQAALFAFHISGAGYQYHHCFTRRKLDFSSYDSAWKEFMGLRYRPVDAMRIAFWRLFYPVGLVERHRLMYMDYLREHAGNAVEWLTQTRNPEGLAFLLDRTEPDRDALDRACETARASDFPETAAILLEALHRRFPRKDRKVFDL